MPRSILGLWPGFYHFEGQIFLKKTLSVDYYWPSKK